MRASFLGVHVTKYVRVSINKFSRRLHVIRVALLPTAKATTNDERDVPAKEV